MSEEFHIFPIGYVRSNEEGFLLQIEPPYFKALKELDGFSHIQVLWWPHLCATPENRKITEVEQPYRNAPAKIGIFATRSQIRPNPEKYYQVVFWPDQYDLDGVFLMCAVEVNDLSRINLNLVGKQLPSAKYLRFIHKGLACKVGLTYKYIYESWLPKSDYRLSYPFNFELYGEKCLGPDNPESESEIYIPVE